MAYRAATFLTRRRTGKTATAPRTKPRRAVSTRDEDRPRITGADLTLEASPRACHLSDLSSVVEAQRADKPGGRVVRRRATGEPDRVPAARRVVALEQAPQARDCDRVARLVGQLPDEA